MNLEQFDVLRFDIGFDIAILLIQSESLENETISDLFLERRVLGVGILYFNLSPDMLKRSIALQHGK